MTLKHYLALLDLGCVLLAAGLWYLAPAGMPWTLPLGLGLAPWVVRLLLTGRLTRRSQFDLPLLLFLATAAVSVWAAYDRQAAWSKFWLIVGAVLLFYTLVNARPLWPRQGVTAADWRVWGLAGLGAALALYFTATHDWQAAPSAMAAVDRWGMAVQHWLPALPGHRLNPNVAGGMLAFAAPFAAALLLTAGELPHQARLWQAVAGVALIVILLALILTVSRGAWLALAGAAFLAGLWWAAGWLGRRTLPAKRRPSRRYRFRRQRAIFAAGLLLVAILGLAGLALATNRVMLLVESQLGAPLAEINRLALWRGALALALDYPFTGSGLGGFMMLYSTYSLLIHVGHSFHAHNLFLNVALEQGSVALLLLAGMWLLMGAAVHDWLRPRRPDEKAPVYPPALGAAAVALTTILLHGLVDDAFYGSRALLLLFIPLAFAVPRPARQRRPFLQPATGPGDRRPYLPLALVGASLLALLLVWRGPLAGAWYANLGAVAQTQAELRGYSWPEVDIQDRQRQTADLTTAVSYYQQALEADPWQATANRRLGLIALARQEYPAALAHLQRAYQATPWDNATRQWLGEAYVVNGRVAEGAALWATVLQKNNQLAARAYWYGQLNDPQRLAWVQEAAALASR